MRDNEKQVITREVIEKELLLKRKSNDLVLLSLLIPIFVYFIYYFCVITYQIDFADIKSILKFVFLTLVGIVIVVFYLYGICRFRKTISYKIELERLHHKRQEAPLGIYAAFHKKYKLYFVSGLVCSCPEIKAFDISDMLAFNEAKETDEFYVVQQGKRILSAFNTRYFELDKELEKELRN